MTRWTQNVRLQMQCQIAEHHARLCSPPDFKFKKYIKINLILLRFIFLDTSSLETSSLDKQPQENQTTIILVL